MNPEDWEEGEETKTWIDIATLIIQIAATLGFCFAMGYLGTLVWDVLFND